MIKLSHAKPIEVKDVIDLVDGYESFYIPLGFHLYLIAKSLDLPIT